MKIYIRKSSRKFCNCGSKVNTYSLIQDKVVRATICVNCYRDYVNSLKDFELIFLTFSCSSVLPSFLKEIENESKVA